MRVKEEEVELNGQLSNVHLSREINIGWKVHGCLSPYNYRSQGLLVVFGSMPKKLKYVQLDKARQIEIQGDWDSYIGHLLLIEKQNIRDQQLD